jgi:hypothetical protein
MRMAPAVEPPSSTGRLGDWYAGLVFVRRRPLLLFVSEQTRLPVLVPASPTRLMPARFKIALRQILVDLAIDPALIAQELRAVDSVVVAATQNRSLLGTINDFTLAIKLAVEDRSAMSFHELSLWLADTPIRPLDNDPARATRRRLAETVH